MRALNAMNELDRRRWERSQKTLRADETARENPDLAISWFVSAHLLKTVKLSLREDAEAINILSAYLEKISPFFQKQHR